MAILTQLGTEQNWEEEEEELWDEHYTAHFHTCFTTNGEQVYRFSQLSLNYYPKLYIASTINIWKKVLTKAIWAEKKWAGFWQISF